MARVYSVKVDDDMAHHFDACLRVLGTNANAKLNELIREYMLGSPVEPPPLPTTPKQRENAKTWWESLGL